MADYDKDFIFYDDSDDELVDVSNGIKTAEESANSKKGAKHLKFQKTNLTRF